MRGRLTPDAHGFSFVVPDGLQADFIHDGRARKLIAAILDLVLAHEPIDHHALLEVRGYPAPDATHVVLAFSRHGGSAIAELGGPAVQHLTERADGIGATVVFSEPSPDALSVVVTLPTR